MKSVTTFPGKNEHRISLPTCHSYQCTSRFRVQFGHKLEKLFAGMKLRFSPYSYHVQNHADLAARDSKVTVTDDRNP